MNISFLAEAQTEMLEAATFYEQRQTGLGVRFLEAVSDALVDIERHPTRWPTLGKGIRRRLVGHFPYGILYRRSHLEITIVAVMHLHRHPRYWTKRL
jgi:plasmid stabilization system protein ParE